MISTSSKKSISKQILTKIGIDATEIDSEEVQFIFFSKLISYKGLKYFEFNIENRNFNVDEITSLSSALNELKELSSLKLHLDENNLGDKGA